MKRFVHLLLVLAFVFMANLHLPFFQVVAWTSMLATYSQQVPFREAVEMTFGGDNPCNMCTAIKKQQEPDASTLKALPLVARPFLFIEPPILWIQSISRLGSVPEQPESAPSFSPQPERRPPRSFA